MKITDVKIKKIEGEGNLKAMVSFNFDSSLVVTGFRLIKGPTGLFLSMPSRKLDKPSASGKNYIDTTYPVTKDFKYYMSEEALRAYNNRAPSEPVIAGIAQEDLPF